MLKEFIWKFGIIVCFLFVSFALQSQYRITGGKGTPMLAVDDSPNRVQVYMVYGASNVEISYTSSSSSHQWYRYKLSRKDAEKIPSVQNGTTSTIQSPEDGYGYYVEEPSIIQERYVWIVDYSKHAFNISVLYVSDKGDPCYSVLLEGTAEMDRMAYYRPSGGADVKINREFDITYNTLEWDEEHTSFSQKEVKETVSDPFSTTLDAPLCDTDFQLKGDQFARHFGMEKSATTGEYQAVAIEAHAYSGYMEDESSNMSTEKQGISAPVTVKFNAFANDPVAALYTWTVYKDEDLPDGQEIDPIIRITGDMVEYTFQQAGNFIARLEVSDRTGKCSQMQEIALSVSESALKIPNAFSPGTTPGINDEFKVVYKSLVRFKATIFNRWGTQMFQWTDPAQGWDGKKNGKYVPPGVYFYVIEATGSDGIKYKESGDINLLRPKTIDDQIHE